MIEKNNNGVQADPGVLLLRYILVFNLLTLLIFVGGSLYLYDWVIARSVLAGGVLAGGSFFMLKKDIERIMGKNCHVLDAPG